MKIGQGADVLPDIPSAFGYLWQWFIDLSEARTVGMAVSPITWSEIEAYSVGLQLGITPWERKVLHDMDRAALTVIRERESRAQRGEQEAVIVHDQPMTPELFGAMFGGGKE